MHIYDIYITCEHFKYIFMAIFHIIYIYMHFLFFSRCMYIKNFSAVYLKDINIIFMKFYSCAQYVNRNSIYIF